MIVVGSECFRIVWIMFDMDICRYVANGIYLSLLD